MNAFMHVCVCVCIHAHLRSFVDEPFVCVCVFMRTWVRA